MAKPRGRFALLALPLLAALPARAATPAVLGNWLTADGDGVIRIFPCDTGICGAVAGQSTPGSRAWTGQPLCGFVFIRVRQSPGEDGRLHGRVTDPRNGRVYHAELWRGSDGAVRLRGYIGIELFGSTERWPAFTGTLGADCRFTR